jgi:hypothetical protein
VLLMSSRHLTVFDPALCCSTGVCGIDVDPALAQFAADIEWLAGQGVTVVRYNLAQEPVVFARHPAVRHLLQSRGVDVLPIVVAGEDVVATAAYPTRAELARLAGVEVAG